VPPGSEASGSRGLVTDKALQVLVQRHAYFSVNPFGKVHCALTGHERKRKERTGR